jgi:hypothetical protein
MANDVPKPDFDIEGAIGLPVFSGRVYDEYLRELQQERGRRILREMSEQDPVIGASLLAIEMLARQVDWKTIPANQTPQAQEVADFVDTCFMDLQPSWEDTLSEILTMLVYGWSWMEVLYKTRGGLDTDNPLQHSMYDDGKIGWRGWAPRNQETLYQWLFDDAGEIVAMRQIPPPDYIIRTVPRDKSLHFRTKSRRGNPEGVSILRNAYRPWYFKQHIEQIEGIGVERDLAGLPVMWVPQRLLNQTNPNPNDTALLAQLQRIITNIRRDEQEGVLLPLSWDAEGNQQYKLELLTSGGQRQFDTNKIIERYDQRIAMTMLADFLLLGHENVGSFALADSKTELFGDALGAILDAICREINTRAIPQIVRFNGWPVDLAPTRNHGDIESVDIGKLGTYIQQLAGAGMPLFPSTGRKLEQYLLEQAGLPNAGTMYTIPPPGQPGDDEAEVGDPESALASEDGGPDIVVIEGVLNGPGGPAQEQDGSPLFLKRLRYAQGMGKPYYVYSAKHGLVDPNEMIHAHDVVMDDLSPNERQALGQNAVARLKNDRGQLDGVIVEVHGSKSSIAALNPYFSAEGARMLTPTDNMTMPEQLDWYDRQAAMRTGGADISPMGSQSASPATASERFHTASTHHRHFGPSLQSRVGAILNKPTLKKLDKGAYLDFLDTVMRTRSFRSLSGPYQNLITQAEADDDVEPTTQTPPRSIVKRLNGLSNETSPNRATEIRRLASTGMPRGDIARRLGIRIQQVHNTLG